MVKSPQFSTAVGLLLYAMKEQSEKQAKVSSEATLKALFKGFLNQVKEMFTDLK